MKNYVDFCADVNQNSNPQLALDLVRFLHESPEAIHRYFGDIGYGDVTLQECEKLFVTAKELGKDFGVDRAYY